MGTPDVGREIATPPSAACNDGDDPRFRGPAELEGKVALVTGGSRGLGAAIARDLARSGADVCFTYRRAAEEARSLEAELSARLSSKSAVGRRVLAVQADVGDFVLARQVVQQVLDAFGRLDILVCNAGISRGAPIWEMTEEQWDTVLETNLKGSFNYIRWASPLFRDQGHGKIVVVGSINGLRGRPGYAGYCTSKAALAGLVRTVARELGLSNINVNLVAPGFVDVESQASTPLLIRELVLNECAIKRLGQPEEIAAVVTFLCTERARHITGQVVQVDAGQWV